MIFSRPHFMIFFQGPFFMIFSRPHFMMPPGNEVHEAPSNGASATAYEKLQRGHTSQVRTTSL